MLNTLLKGRPKTDVDNSAWGLILRLVSLQAMQVTWLEGRQVGFMELCSTIFNFYHYLKLQAPNFILCRTFLTRCLREIRYHVCPLGFNVHSSYLQQTTHNLYIPPSRTRCTRRHPLQHHTIIEPPPSPHHRLLPVWLILETFFEISLLRTLPWFFRREHHHTRRRSHFPIWRNKASFRWPWRSCDCQGDWPERSKEEVRRVARGPTGEMRD